MCVLSYLTINRASLGSKNKQAEKKELIIVFFSLSIPHAETKAINQKLKGGRLDCHLRLLEKGLKWI